MSDHSSPPNETAPAVDADALILQLEALAEDRGRLASLSQPQRQRLLMAAGRLAHPVKDERVRLSKALRRKDRQESRAHDEALVAQSGLRVQRRAEVFTPLWLPPPEPEGRDEEPLLQDERACYVCKQRYRQVHFFYDAMCPSCGDFNYAKRRQSADLRGKVALVTGGRVKIGYQASLILLRSGARVVVTTRFPRDAARRYATEPDFEAFRDRLQLHGLDLRHAPSVELFSRWLADSEGRLDLIINNACQTVRRPPGFYAHLLEGEATASASESHLQPLLAAHVSLVQQLRETPQTGHAPSLMTTGPGRGAGIVDAPALSQLRYLDEDFAGGEALFPTGQLDEDLQQRDLRAVNSWRLKLAEVSTPELLEVHLVNAVAPFILNGRLRALMARGNEARDRHIVNVSAMEGQFYRTKKTDRHPHTNMAKAALNMMTRTSAPDYLQDGIHMNAVDTGWVTDEDPAALAARKAELGFAPPLDIIDGAARICDPYIAGQTSGQHVWGQFLKDYQPAPW